MSIIERLCEDCGERHPRCQKAEIASAKDRATKAEAALERERTHVSRYARKVRLAFQSRDWIMEGRGSYEWNDDSYRDEVRHLYDDVEPNLAALEKIAGDLANCPKTQEAVEAARNAARAASPLVLEAALRYSYRWAADPDAAVDAAIRHVAALIKHGSLPDSIEPPPPRCGEESAQAHEMLEEMRRHNLTPQRLDESNYLGVSAKRWSEIHGNAYALLGLSLQHVAGTLRDAISAHLANPAAPIPATAADILPAADATGAIHKPDTPVTATSLHPDATPPRRRKPAKGRRA